MIVWVWFMIVIGSATAFSGFVFKFLAFDSAYTYLDDPTLGVQANTAFTNIMIDVVV